jgi:hypothetical protein
MEDMVSLSWAWWDFIKGPLEEMSGSAQDMGFGKIIQQ